MLLGTCKDMHVLLHFFSVSNLAAWPREGGEHHYPSWIFKAMGEREGAQNKEGYVIAHGWGRRDDSCRMVKVRGREWAVEMPWISSFSGIGFPWERAPCYRISTWTCRLPALLGWQPVGALAKLEKRAHFLYATYLIRLSTHGITLPLTPTFPFRMILLLVQQPAFHFAHSSSRFIRNISSLMQVTCLTLLPRRLFHCQCVVLVDCF